jgi:hypothetical protein
VDFANCSPFATRVRLRRLTFAFLQSLARLIALADRSRDNGDP